MQREIKQFISLYSPDFQSLLQQAWSSEIITVVLKTRENKAEQTESQQLFSDPSDNGGHRAIVTTFPKMGEGGGH